MPIRVAHVVISPEGVFIYSDTNLTLHVHPAQPLEKPGIRVRPSRVVHVALPPTGIPVGVRDEPAWFCGGVVQ